MEVLTREDTVTNISSYYHVNPVKTRKVTKKLNTDFKAFKYKTQDSFNQVFPQNMGEILHIDEVALSNGELFTLVTNPKSRAKQNTIVAIIEGTKASDIISVLNDIALCRRKKVKAVSSDMAPNMQLAIKQSFENAEIVIDKFHVIKLVLEALETQRIQYRWMVIDLENERLKHCKHYNFVNKVRRYSNGDTEKQLLSRSKYILFKTPDKWTEKQRIRAHILFKNYPRLKYLYEHSLAFRHVYQQRNKEKAQLYLEQWIAKSFEIKEDVFRTAATSIARYSEPILSHFHHWITNAFAESFNSKIKRFRANLRGVSCKYFFHYRLTKLFA